MQQIAVTGAAGFIGRALVPALVDAGFQVTAVDRMTSSSGPLGVNWIQGDLHDSTFAALALAGADLCIALAGISGGVGYSSKRPASILKDNLLITVETLQACVKHGVRRIIFVSTSCVFSRLLVPPFREEDVDIQQPTLPTGYALSKLVGEKLCQAYQAEYGLDFTIVRAFNAYGPGESPGPHIGDGHVIPELTARILDGENPLRLLGNGEQTRSFLFIDDLVSALLATVTNFRATNVDLNIGSSEEISITDLARRIWSHAKMSGNLSFQHVDGFSCDVPRRAADSRRASTLLGWRPTVPLDEGLRRYVNWYRKELQ